MRLILNTLVLLTLMTMLGGVVWTQRELRADQKSIESARLDVQRLVKQVQMHAALGSTQQSARGYPVTIDPGWFRDDLPLNPLLESYHPWLEIAGTHEAHLMHPQIRIAGDRGLARFWYNPSTGTVRARVPEGVSDAKALAMYNYINGCTLLSLFDGGDVAFTGTASATNGGY